MTDEETLALFPALREFVDAVNDRDQDLVKACLMHTPAETLAVLAAGWVGDLLNEAKRMRERTSVAEKARRLAEAQAKAASDRERATRADLSAALEKVTRLQGDLYLARKKVAA